MGIGARISEKLIGLSKSRRGKAISFLVAALASALFIVGITLTGVGASGPTVTAIELRSSGLRTDEKDGLILDVTNGRTAITAMPKPASVNSPVTFSVAAGGGDYVKFEESRVPANGTAILVVTPREGQELSATVRINIRCGNASETVNVNLAPTSEDFRVTATLERNDLFFQNFWLPANRGIEMKYFFSGGGLYKKIQYRVHFTFTLFGQEIYNTRLRPEDYAFFDYAEQGPRAYRSNVKLIDREDTANLNKIAAKFIDLDEKKTFYFDVWANYGGKEFHAPTNMAVLMVENEVED